MLTITVSYIFHLITQQSLFSPIYSFSKQKKLFFKLIKVLIIFSNGASNYQNCKTVGFIDLALK